MATAEKRKRSTSRGTLLFSVRKPVPIKVYGVTFTPFEFTKYLDEKALKAAKSLTIECGTVEGGGIRRSLLAELRNGFVVGIRPKECADCGSKNSKGLRRRFPKRTLLKLKQELRERGLATPFTPVPIPIRREGGWKSIPVGDCCHVIWIRTGDAGTATDVCVATYTGRYLCYVCVVFRSDCS